LHWDITASDVFDEERARVAEHHMEVLNCAHALEASGVFEPNELFKVLVMDLVK